MTKEIKKKLNVHEDDRKQNEENTNSSWYGEHGKECEIVFTESWNEYMESHSKPRVDKRRAEKLLTSEE
jgi:hypothetical protein